MVTAVPPCSRLSSLSVGNITDNSAMLTWTDNYNQGATYIVQTSTGATVATVSDAMSYTVSQLTAQTEYTYQVVAECGNDGTSTPVSVTFTTDCAAEDLPYSEGFESGSLDCWTQSGMYIWSVGVGDEYENTGTATGVS